MNKKRGGLLSNAIENAKVLVGAIPLVIMAILFIASILYGISPDIWHMTFGDLVKQLLGMAVFALIIYSPFYIKYRRDKARHIKWHKDHNIPLANDKDQCYCITSKDSGLTKTI